MADAVTLVKGPEEKMSAFNARLKQTCTDRPVTGFELLVVDGQPVVAMICEEVQAEEEDVKEAKLDDPESDLEVGTWIPAEDPIVIQVARVTATTEEDCAKSEQRLEGLYNRAKGNVIRHAAASGISHLWIPDISTIPLDPKTNAPVEGGKATKYFYGPVSASFVAVAYLADEGDIAAQERDGVERTLQGRGKKPESTGEET